MEETEKEKVMMICWENSDGSLLEEPNKKTDKQTGRADDTGNRKLNKNLD